MKKCDLGILLGGPILEQEFNQLIAMINSHWKGSKDETSVNRSIGMSIFEQDRFDFLE